MLGASNFDLMAEATGEPGTGPMIEPDDLVDEGYAESSASSLLSTVPTEVNKLKEEHGRLWAAHGKNEYYLPVDDDELDRLDLNHYKYTMIQSGELFLAPIGDHPQNILDLGTGTGIWAIEVADKYPSANVIGTDIAAVQPLYVPPNCTFQIDDAEDDWTFKAGRFDYIHNRDFYQSIRDWPRLVRQSWDAIRPGGWLEFSGIYPVPKCDDGSCPDDSAYMEVASSFQAISKLINADPDAATKWKTWMEEIGFVEVTERIFYVPCSPWARDKRLKKIGAFELMNLLQGAQAFLVKGYTKEMGRSREEMELLIYRMRKELLSGKVHAYAPFYVVYGKKPG